MITLHPEFLKKNNNIEYAILSYDEYCKLKEYLDDIEDLLDIKKIKFKEKNNRSASLESVKQTLGID